MNLINKFLKTSAVYLFGKIATYVVSFVMLRYYTTNLSPAAYGDYEYIYSLINVAVPALFIEIWSGVLRFTISAKADEKGCVISTVFLMLIPTVALYTVVYFLITIWMQWELSGIVYAFALSFMLVNIMMMISRALEKNALFVLSGIIGALANAGVGMFCVSVLKLQTEAVMYAMISNYLLQILILGVGTKVWKFVRLKNAKKSVAKALVRYCAPFLPNTVLYYINTNYYMSVVRAILGREALGLFTASTKFCVVVTFVVSVFHLAWQEITYSISHNQEKKETYANGLNVFMDISLVGTLVLLPLVKIVFPYFIGAEFAASSAYVPAYYSTVFFTAVSGFMYNTLAAENITIFHPITKVISATINMTVLYTLIGTLGIYAVIIGAVVSAAVEVFVLTVVIRKKIGLRFGFYKVILFAACYLVGCVFYNNFGVGVNAGYMVLMIFLGIAYFLFSNRHMVKAVLSGLKKA